MKRKKRSWAEWAERAKRVADFHRRWRYRPASIRTVPRTGWRYINIHPLSDEQEVLAKLGMRPEDCTHVDAYWEFGGDVAFLQLSSEGSAISRPKGLFARWDTHKRPPMLYLYAVVPDPFISSRVMEHVMRLYATLNLRGERFRPGRIPGPLVLIDAW